MLLYCPGVLRMFYMSLKIHFNVILPYILRSSTWSLSLTVFHQKPFTPLPSPICAMYHTLPILPDFITQITFGGEYIPQSSLLRKLLHSVVTSSLSGPYIFLNNLFLKNPFCAHSSMWDTKFHNKTKDRQNYSSFSSSYFCIANWKTKDSALHDRRHFPISACS